jgi:hypothetical protein
VKKISVMSQSREQAGRTYLNAAIRLSKYRGRQFAANLEELSNGG